MNRRSFMAFLAALGIAPKIAPDVAARDLPRCIRCHDEKLVTVVTTSWDDYFSFGTCYTRIDCPDCNKAKFDACMQDFGNLQKAQIRFQLSLDPIRR